MKRILTDKDRAYIDANCFLQPARQIGEVLGINKGTVRSYLRNKGITIPKELAHKWRTEGMHRAHAATIHPEDDVIKAEYLITNVNQLSIKVGRSEQFVNDRLRHLGLVIPPNIIEQRKQSTRMKKGHIPFNKGKKQEDYMTPEGIERAKKNWFKAGEIPPNKAHFKDGDITVRKDSKTKRSYYWIRIRLRIWKMLHVKLWEDEYGAVPDGHIVVFKDKNSLNCELQNLELISIEENMRRNTIHNYPPEIKEIIRINTKLNKAIHEKQNQRSAQPHVRPVRKTVG